MKDFKSTKKALCFREGGQVSYKSRKPMIEEADADMKQDKLLVKKGVKQHEAALHKGEPKTALTLKKGGRAKKDCGTVKKYKTGGTVENQYAAKKTEKDIKDIANTKRQKPQMLCGGKSVRKMAEGGGVFETLKNNIMGTPEQNAIAQAQNDKYVKAKMAQKAAGQQLGLSEEMALKLGQMGQKANAPSGAMSDKEGAFNKKRGGKVCK